VIHRRGAVLTAILALYLALAVLMTWPLVARLPARLPGIGGDLWVHWWNLWWLKQAALEGFSPFHTDLLFYPQGLSLAYHNFAWFHAALWLPLQTLVGGVTAYGLIFLLTFALSGVGMFLLLRELTKSAGAALVAGLVYAFWPYTMSHFNHTNMMAVQWLPLVLLGLRRVILRGRNRDALLTALFLALTGLARWHHLIFGGLIFGLYLLWSLLTERGHWNWCTIRLLALAGTLAGLVLLPLALPLLTSQLTRDYPDDIFVEERREGQTDLLAYWVPNRSHPLWGSAVRPLYERFDVNTDHIAYLGYAALGLAAYGLIRRWRETRFWLLAAVAVMLMAMGANLRVAGYLYPNVPTPYRLVDDLFFIRLLRQPDRFNIVLGLPVAVLVGWGAATVLAARPRWRTWVTVGLSALILLDYVAVPFATVVPHVPAWYSQLATEPDDFGILPIPMGVSNSKEHMLYQTVHSKATVTGETARPPREAFAFIEANPLLRGMSETGQFDSSLADVSRQLRRLAESGVRYVVLHPEMASDERVAGWQDWLTIVPPYADDEVIVYYTTPEYGRDFDFTTELGDSIGLITATLSTPVLAQDGLLEVDLRWGTRAAPTRDWLARLALVSPTGQIVQAVDVEPCAGWPTSEWGASAVARGRADLQIDPFLEGGTYAATLVLVDPLTGGVAGEAVRLSWVEVQAVERTFEMPEVTMPVDALFGDVLRLLGYDVHRAGSELILRLHWQALCRMDVAYKMFVHLVDPATDQVVAQVDVMPRDWGYPTHWWEMGEVVSDEIVLSLAEVPPGAYWLEVGVYDQGTGERLVVQDETDRLVLESVVVP
jgi:hypothetical protein